MAAKETWNLYTESMLKAFSYETGCKSVIFLVTWKRGPGRTMRSSQIRHRNQLTVTRGMEESPTTKSVRVTRLVQITSRSQNEF